MKPLATLMTALTVALFTLMLKNQHSPTNAAAVARQLQQALPTYATALAACPKVDSSDDQSIAIDEHWWSQ